jgi:hypothetical protein
MDEFGMNTGNAGQTAWGLFALTGGIGYYLLHKELNGEHDADRRDKRLD